MMIIVVLLAIFAFAACIAMFADRKIKKGGKGWI
jgi:hypothetical protein